eukprot:TRINITY_DN83639_c0_g1_i1.p1 TRINITY_DN83639_c0_g1~~TRINITY_DN83639_c0_g1_i1.p1  ORF type:complete len:210 (-),score=13.59 TRINITY_DN83639_c0_g1_i1:33-662(-)
MAFFGSPFSLQGNGSFGDLFSWPSSPVAPASPFSPLAPSYTSSFENASYSSPFLTGAYQSSFVQPYGLGATLFASYSNPYSFSSPQLAANSFTNSYGGFGSGASTFPTTAFGLGSANYGGFNSYGYGSLVNSYSSLGFGLQYPSTTSYGAANFSAFGGAGAYTPQPFGAIEAPRGAQARLPTPTPSNPLPLLSPKEWHSVPLPPPVPKQ